MNILNKARELIRRIIEGIYCALGLGMPVHYVNSGEALPPPLSKQEEAECIGALAAGDESMRRVLIERNLRLVVYIARKFENTGVNIEDLISIGAIGLIKAVNTFDAENRACRTCPRRRWRPSASAVSPARGSAPPRPFCRRRTAAPAPARTRAGAKDIFSYAILLCSRAGCTGRCFFQHTTPARGAQP